jgi:hypothetical protein
MLEAGCTALTWQAMHGHLPGPPQPHFPEGLGPFIGYLATREPRPIDERALVPQEPGWAEADELYVLDEFDDVGEWEPMHRPLVKVTAVIVSISLVVAGLGTILELLLSAH